MRLTFTVPVGDKRYFYTLLLNNDFQVIDHYGVIYLRIWKVHDHCYYMAGFLYQSRRLIVPTSYNTKSKLYGAIKKLLQEEL